MVSQNVSKVIGCDGVYTLKKVKNYISHFGRFEKYYKSKNAKYVNNTGSHYADITYIGNSFLTIFVILRDEGV